MGIYMGISENRGPKYSTLHSRIPYYRDPKITLIFRNFQRGLPKKRMRRAECVASGALLA